MCMRSSSTGITVCYQGIATLTGIVRRDMCAVAATTAAIAAVTAIAVAGATAVAAVAVASLATATADGAW